MKNHRATYLKLKRQGVLYTAQAKLAVTAFVIGAVVTGFSTYIPPAVTHGVVAPATATPQATQTSEPTRAPKTVTQSPEIRAAATVDAPTPNAKPMTGLPATKPFKVVIFRISHYWPALGGTNCYPTNWIKDALHPMGGICRSKLLGEPWSTWAGVGAACPPSVDLRQRIYVERLNRSFYCVDRGGAIQDLYDGTSFIDILIPEPVWWPNADVITDRFCPSGCLTSPGYVMP